MAAYYAWQFREQDEFDARTAEFLDRVIEKFGLRGDSTSEIKVRSVNSAYSNVETDDKIIEVLSNNKLIALQYLRRDDLNYTEVTNIILDNVTERL